MRLWFGYERNDNPEVAPLINALCKGALNRLLNHFLPAMKLESKQRVGSKVVRQYGRTQTPWSRVLACAEIARRPRNGCARKSRRPIRLR